MIVEGPMILPSPLSEACYYHHTPSSPIWSMQPWIALPFLHHYDHGRGAEPESWPVDIGDRV
jgi:hypothetical protein